jgi:hypothetical protein
MEALAIGVASAPFEEQEAAIAVFARLASIPALDPKLVDFALNWLEQNASPNVSPIAKYYLADLAARLTATGRRDTGNLILLVQPIPTENKGTWARIEHYLVSTLNTDVIFFNSFCVKLADRNAHGWLKVMQEPRAFEWLLREMRGRDVSALANVLLFSRDVGCRKLGLFVFDELDLNSLSGSLLSEIDEHRLRLGFYEACRTLIHGKAIARFLVALIPRIEKAPEKVQKEFFDELVLQAKNYSGQCRHEFEGRANEFPILKRALDVANPYFEHLTQARKSPIGQMDVPGYLQAALLYARRFSTTVSKGAEEASVFMTLFKKVQLLYGRSWSSYDGGALSRSSELKAISASVEIPRLENIDPEGMALHRLEISTSIASLGEAGTGAQLPK